MTKSASIQSKGGAARAAKLSREQRKEIASRAAAARWGHALPKATHFGDLQLSKRSVSAAVLPDGTRLITQGTFLQAIGRSRTPKAGAGGLTTVDELPFFLQAETLAPYITHDLRSSTTPIQFQLPTGQKAIGYDARLLPMVCEVYLKLRDDCLSRGVPIPGGFRHIVSACDVLMRAFAHVGIIALVDEATGYQYDRARNALAKILERFIAKELQPWTRTFPLEFYQEIFRLKQWAFNPDTMQSPRVLGKYTNNIVYDRLAPGVLQQLRDKNPPVDGRRKHKHFQWLTGDVGHPKLLAHLEGVKVLMKLSTNWDDFLQKLDILYPAHKTTELGFDVDVKPRPKIASESAPVASVVPDEEPSLFSGLAGN